MNLLTKQQCLDRWGFDGTVQGAKEEITKYLEWYGQQEAIRAQELMLQQVINETVEQLPLLDGHSFVVPTVAWVVARVGGDDL